jgi:hypothetical protein
MCGDLWLSNDGARIFTRCGNTFLAANQQGEDMVYGGSLDVSVIRHLSHAPTRGEIAVIPDLPEDGATGYEDTVVRLFDDEVLEATGNIALPCVDVEGQTVTGHGRFVFPLGDASGYVVVLEPDPGSTVDGHVGLAIVR